MKYGFIIFLYLLLSLKANSQISLQTFINVYSKNSLTEARKSFRALPNFQAADSLKADSIVGSVKEGKIKAYVKHNKTNIQFSFTDETLYKSLYVIAST